MNERLGGSILVGLIVKFAVLNDLAVQQMMAHDTLDFEVMGSVVVAPLTLRQRMGALPQSRCK
jgi:hypothetical protein